MSLRSTTRHPATERHPSAPPARPLHTRASLARPAPGKFASSYTVALVALGAILLAVVFDAAILIMHGLDEGFDHPFHQLTSAALLLIFIGVIVCYRLLQDHLERLAVEPARIEELRRAKEGAETANLAKARYLANVSHEIRSPLNAIYGYAQLIEQEADVRPKDAARIIRRCAEHMTSLVESLLDISQAENGVLRLRSEIVRLPDFIEQIVLMMRPAAEAKGLTFVHEVNGRLPEFVRTDQSRLRQALINLVGNAIKFTDTGTVAFRVGYRGQIASFEVSDTGPGIAPQDSARIFDPYEQVASEAAGVRPGIGLGLPITKAIIEILGGKLELQSEPGSGATFTATLMLSEVAQAIAADVPTRRIIGHEGVQRSVLVVDDDPDQRAFVERFFLECGFDTVAVPSGEAAVAMCATRGFDLAVLDISLPGISGWEVAEHISAATGRGAAGEARSTAIVMASANAREFHRPDYHRPVHDHFFVKPYRLDELAEVVGALLEVSWKWAATSADEPAQQSESALPAAARPHVDRIAELVRIGHVRGIETEIRLLATAAPARGKMISALYAALDEFDLARVARILEEA